MIHRSILAFLTLCLFAWPATAGTQCKEKPPTVNMISMASDAAIETYQALDNSGAEAAILARVGADISEYGLRYTHAAIAVREHPKGHWFIRHQLNICATDRSELFDQGLMNFFLDDPVVYETGVLIPSTDLQARIKAVVLSPKAARLHHDDYSMIANPFSTRYQNSNQWMLELIAAAQAPHEIMADRRLAQQWLRKKGYRPSRIAISPFKLLGASLFRANIRFDDHTKTERDNGRYNVVSVRSIRDFLYSQGKIADEFVVRP
ncbi:MAG: DUF2145 domain-containing protein [Alphaproteobacteria bacterium]|jgi:hypothetical protein|nr:DUF2145 domain-containing protein [Alphaproteobacteria bacterium]MDP6876833.1 DUF2145 domain-containing protein [Alphaproteobacteria bacterium]